MRPKSRRVRWLSASSNHWIHLFPRADSSHVSDRTLTGLDSKNGKRIHVRPQHYGRRDRQSRLDGSANGRCVQAVVLFEISSYRELDQFRPHRVALGAIQKEKEMPLGEVIGEYNLKATSVTVQQIADDRTRYEINFMGEASGRIAGQAFGTFTVEGPAAGPGVWSYTGSILANQGATIIVTAQGVSAQMPGGHRFRIRGTALYKSSSPALASLGEVVGAVEGEGDPATLTLKGAVCEWK